MRNLAPILAIAMAAAACSGDAAVAERNRQIAEAPGTEVTWHTTMRHGFGHVEVNGRECIIYRYGDNDGVSEGIGAGLSCDWNDN